jgi:GntP family gluconate:H+ symporter
MIGFGSFWKVLVGYPGFVEALGGTDNTATIAKFVLLLGNKNIALLLGTAIALGVLARQRGLSLTQVEELLAAPIGTAAVIILITAAGGAFGGMLRHAGVGDAIKAVASTYDIDVIVLAWATAAVIRVAQGSATVAMLTTSAILWDMVDPARTTLGYHTMYVFLAIGFGGFTTSWMNDSGFWVVSKLGGLTEKETLKSWTVMLTVLSVVGLILTWIASRVLPLV